MSFSVSDRSFFFEALAQCGSTSCVNILSSLIMNNKVPKHKVDKLISSIAFIQEPSTEMINTVMVRMKFNFNFKTTVCILSL